MMNKHRLHSIYKVTLALVGFSVAGYLFIYPACLIAYEFARPGLAEGEPSILAIRAHKRMAPRYQKWAEKRVASARAAELTTDDLVETEWAPFGSVFFLWATESLQAQWEKDSSLSKRAPKDYAAGAIEASAALLVDPNHATWVKQHWGDDYLHEENAFYRMMLIGGLTAHHNLTGDPKYLGILRDQVETLAAEIDASPAGLLNDYPGECYPGDVLTAIACIRRADAVLGTDHQDFVTRALRGFQGDNLDAMGLVPFMAYPPTGEPIGLSRGSGNSYASIFGPELWPEDAKAWYDRYEEHFWNDGLLISGFREYARTDDHGAWEYDDMDAGPVIAGYGMAASAFGLGAARVNGRMDHAYSMTTEMLAASWPLPDGTLLIPRLLSSATDAPYLGEVCIIYNLTRQPAAHVAIVTGGRIPPLAYGLWLFYVVMGTLTVVLSLRELKHLLPRQILTLSARSDATRVALPASVATARRFPCGTIERE